ncbi:MAG: alpha amylase C-terminal domain-containing protein, partial [Eubacterium sp.]|nr:alpha amylase C-terminal domain-containing protein [Eubacterium sp.]
HPGKKLIAAGQDFGQKARVDAENGVAWKELDNDDQQKMKAFSKALLKLYREQPALFQLDDNPDGFEWISNLDWERNLLVFLRKTQKQEETLLVVANFSNVEYDNFMVGVPYPGKYKEIFNSDETAFGGKGITNPRVKLSRAVEQDERKDSIKIKVPPLAVSVFRFTEKIEHIVPGKEDSSAKTVKPAKTVKTAKAEKTVKAVKTAGRTRTAKNTKQSGAAEKTAKKTVKKTTGARRTASGTSGA